MLSISAHSTRVENGCQQLYFAFINKRSTVRNMNMGRRIEAELNERGWQRSRLYELVPCLEDGTLSAIIKRDSKTSTFAPAIAGAFGVELQWLLTGKGNKELGAPPPPLQLVRDPILDDLAALPGHEAEIFRIQIKAAADIQRARDRAAQAAKHHEESFIRDDKPGDSHHPERRRISN